MTTSRGGDGDESQEDPASEAMTFDAFRGSFHYGSRADMQFKFLAGMEDAEAADAIARLLAALGEAFDTGDLGRVREVASEAQLAAYTPDEVPEAQVDTAPFTALATPLHETRVALVSAGGVFMRGDDPMGPDGPDQRESLAGPEP